jgi:hypothetical protein
MPRTDLILRVFVASPDDVQEERARLEQLINRQNRIWSQSYGIRLDLLRWETDTFPGIGTDSQGVINEQIDDNYDIFVGIMWTKAGTPTSHADSGTIEEFDRAYKRFKADSETIRIMFYFCEADIPQSKLDLNQFAKVKNFRNSLEEKGVFYNTYKSAEEFEQHLSLHLPGQILGYGKEWGKSAPSSQMAQVEPRKSAILPSNETLLAQEEAGDDGLLDVIEQGTEDFQTMNQSLQSMSSAIQTLGGRLEKRTREMRSASSKEPDLFLKRARQITNRTAIHLDTFVSQMRNDLPIFSQALSGAVNAVAMAASLAGRFASQDMEPINALLDTVKELKNSTKEALGSTNTFRSNLKAWPPVTRKLNRARARALGMVDELISQLDQGIRLMSAVEEEITKLLCQGE